MPSHKTCLAGRWVHFHIVATATCQICQYHDPVRTKPNLIWTLVSALNIRFKRKSDCNQIYLQFERYLNQALVSDKTFLMVQNFFFICPWNLLKCLSISHLSNCPSLWIQSVSFHTPQSNVTVFVIRVYFIWTSLCFRVGIDTAFLDWSLWSRWPWPDFY